MMEKFDMGKFLQEAGVNLDTGNWKQVVDIPIDRIVPDPNNFYELSAIDDLAENIALFGLQQPIVVRPMPEDDARYIIVSGHRRHAALKKLIEEDGRDDLREVMCIVERGEENPKLNQLKLIYANASTRVLSSAEQAKQAEQVEKLLHELKEEGMEFPGRMRDHVAQACRMSTGKFARLKVILNNLIPPFMKMWEANELSESVAYVLAGQTPVRQHYIFNRSVHDGKFYVPADTLKFRFSRMDKAQEQCDSLSCKYNVRCDHACIRLQMIAADGSVSCIGCCLSCNYLATCKYSCPRVDAKKEKLKEKAKNEKKKEAEEKRIKEQPEKDLLTTSYGRVSQLRKERNVSAEDYVKASLGYAYDRDVKRLNAIDGGKPTSLQDRMPGGIWASEAQHLIAVADLLGCSIDYLLGRTDTPTLSATPAAEPEKCVKIDTWRTVPPDEPGEYVVYISLAGMCAADTIFWTGKDWENPYADSDIIAWTYPPNVEDTI